MLDRYHMEMQQYEQAKRMNEVIEKMEKREGVAKTSAPCLSRPSFDVPPPISQFYIELTLDHPYWGGVRTLDDKAPDWGISSPSVQKFIRNYEAKLKVLHGLASNLMKLISPNAQEVRIPFQAAGGGFVGRAPAASADPVAEIQKYKALLDSGAITEDEFTAKKRQLLGI